MQDVQYVLPECILRNGGPEREESVRHSKGDPRSLHQLGGLPGGLVLVIGILWVLWGDILWISGLCPARFLFLLVGLICRPLSGSPLLRDLPPCPRVGGTRSPSGLVDFAVEREGKVIRQRNNERRLELS
jgi:hypothetical protein